MFMFSSQLDVQPQVNVYFGPNPGLGCLERKGRGRGGRCSLEERRLLIDEEEERRAVVGQPLYSGPGGQMSGPADSGKSWHVRITGGQGVQQEYS